ncbi:MAG: dTMP kinase [Robiginitomaculum sp.]|nr:MAG: dTMP kinase [Robiginitomaculum sp.]
MSGHFITFEGGEGAGKSTQIAALHDFLTSRGISVVCTREPGGTPNAELLRDLVVLGETGRWSALEEMLIMYTARSELVRTLIKPALKEGRWVLSDRFFDSTTVYQGYAGGVPLSRIRKLNEIVLGNFGPDLTLILDVPTNTGLHRVASRAETISRFEKQKVTFYEQVRDGYLQIAKENPKRCQVIDGTQSQMDVSQQIEQIVVKHFDAELAP